MKYEYKARLWNSACNAEIFIPFTVEAKDPDSADQAAEDLVNSMADHFNLTSFGASR